MTEERRQPGSDRSITTAARTRSERHDRSERYVEPRRPDGGTGTPDPSDRDAPVVRPAERVEAVLRGAAQEGLTSAKDGRITGRVSADLIAAAKARTGLTSDTELVIFALANVALEDDFAQIFRDVRGTVDPDLDLGF